MEQIYNFEGVQPPQLNEKLLTAELERRKSRFRVLWFILGAMFDMICIGWFASSIAGSMPVAALILYGYIALSIIGGGTFAICYARKGGATI